jgi:hypothetical protein
VPEVWALKEVDMKTLLGLILAVLTSSFAGAQPVSTYMIKPCRVLDTRIYGGVIHDQETRYLFVQANSGAPGINCTEWVPLDAKGVVFTIAAVDPTGSGGLLVYSSDYTSTRPVATTLNFKAGSGATSSGGASELGQRVRSLMLPDIGIYAAISGSGTAQVVVDVVGYLQ